MIQSSSSISQDSLDLPSILSTFSADEPEDEPSPTAVKSTKPQRPTECLICGNSANGHHYDVASCNGCKTFFRRMCVSDRSFECKAKGDCFDLTKRKVPLKCRACRHQKCISVGMNPLAMEVDEKAASSSNFKKLVKRAQDLEPDDDCQVTAVVNKMQIVKPVDSIESKMQNITDMLVYLETKVERFRKSAYNPHWNEFSGLEYLLESECRIGFGDRFGPMPGWPLRRDQLGPPRLPKPPSPGKPRDSQHSQNIKQWFFYNLLTTVEYAKTFMFFHRLSSRDKLILTRHVALACTNLHISYSSIRRNLEVIIEPDGSEPMTFNDTHYSASVMSVAPLIRCQIKNIEYLLLKAIVLCNPAFHMSLLSHLSRLCCSKCSSIPSSSTRLFCFAPQVGRSTGFLKSTLIKSKQAFRNVSVVETKRESYKLKNASWKDLKAILSLAGPYKWRIMLGISFLGISSSIFLFTPRVLGKLIDEWDETKQDKMDPNDKALLLARFFKENPIALAGVFMLGAIAIAARIYCMHTAGQLVINDLRKSVFNSVLRQDMAFFDKNKVGEIVSRLSTDALIVGYSVSMNLSDGARALITCFGSGGLMVYTSLAMCKVIFVVVPVIVGTFAVFGKLQRKYTLMMQEAVAGANQVATERLSSVRTVRMLVAERKELAAYSDKINEIWQISKKEGLAKGFMFGSFQFTGYLALSSILFYGSNLISQGLLTYGELSSFCLYAVLSAGSLSAMSGFYLELMKGLGASSRLFELKNREPRIPLEGGVQIGNVKDTIRFEHVAFGYADRDPLFHNISFDVPAGKITAVVGSSGSGKSTIASLLLRLYDPTSGRILVDGTDLKDIDPSYWRRHIGTVGQEPVLFSTTIKENIIYGSLEPENVTDAEIVSAADQSNADEFISRFPIKYDTKVGEHGSTLSGGQKQRIAIARALVNKPNILIMDEATSALDASSEYLVRIALNKLLANSKQTVMIIAHRLSTIKHADQIVVVDRGSVAESGSYDELIAIPDGIFRKLVEKQTFGFKNPESY